jgi:hypothetical protein
MSTAAIPDMAKANGIPIKSNAKRPPNMTAVKSAGLISHLPTFHELQSLGNFGYFGLQVKLDFHFSLGSNSELTLFFEGSCSIIFDQGTTR